MRKGYKLGDYLVICDQCGFTRYASECRLTWQNLFVCADRCWRPRHPQDFVRARIDRQRVPIARPDTQVYQRTTTLSSSASEHATSIQVSSISNISIYDGIGIELDNDTIQWTFVSTAPSGSTVTLNNSLLGAATSGNTVYISSGTRFLTATQATATML